VILQTSNHVVSLAMKAIFDISEDVQVKAVKQFVMSDDPENPDPDLDFPGPYELDMEVNVTLVPGLEYEVLRIEETDDSVSLWLNETFCIPNYPKEKVRLI